MRRSRRVGVLLEGLGHDVHDGYPDALDRTDAGGLLSVSVMASVAHELEGYSRAVGAPIRPGDIEDGDLVLLRGGPQAHRRRSTSTTSTRSTRYARHLCRWWADGNDVLVTPTMSEAPPRVGELKGAPVERIVALVPYTSPFNVSGQPAIALPLLLERRRPAARRAARGRRTGREDLLVRVAAQLEAAAPWIDRRPPVCA